MKSRAEIRAEVKEMQTPLPGVPEVMVGKPHVSYPAHTPASEQLVKCVKCGKEDDIDHRGMDVVTIVAALQEAGFMRMDPYSAPHSWTCKDCWV